MIRKNGIYAALSLFMLSNFTGCTILGFIAGSSFDSNNAVIKSPSLLKAEKIKQNTTLKIQFRDNQVMEGIFQGVERVDSATYLQRYNTFRAGLKSKHGFPAINDTIAVFKQSALITTEDNSKYIFSGFDLNTIRFRTLTDHSTKSKNLNDIDFIVDNQGHKINPQIIKGYMDKGFVPLQSELLIRAAGEIQKILMEKVAQIERPKTVTGRIVFSLIGLSIDILIIREGMRRMNRLFEKMLWAGISGN